MSDIRWGILGTARIATKVAEAIHNASGSQLVGIASRDENRASQWAAEHDVAKTYGSYQSLLDDDDIDAIYIPLPPSMHHEWSIAAAERGKHILCEKPVALNANEVAEMTSACRQHNVQFMDGVMWVHHPRTRDMKADLTSGKLGELARLTSGFSFRMETYLQNNSMFSQRGNPPKTLDEAQPTELRLQRDMGGGSLLDLGWYCCRASLWAFDELPQRVWASGRYVYDVDLSFSAVMWFNGDRMASFDCGFDKAWRKWMEIVGTEGSLVCDDFVNPWQTDKPRYWLHDQRGQGNEVVSAADVQEQLMVEHFTQAIVSGELNSDWPDIAWRTQRLCEALDQSARSGDIVEL